MRQLRVLVLLFLETLTKCLILLSDLSSALQSRLPQHQQQPLLYQQPPTSSSSFCCNNNHHRRYFNFQSNSGRRKIGPHNLQAAASSWQDAADFDFSSKIGWDLYYQKTANDGSSVAIPTTEWHKSVSLETIADLVLSPPSTSTAPYEHALPRNCLIVGCGTSNLPGTLLESSSSRRQSEAPIKITLLDSSPTCIHELQHRFGDAVEYCCGDALQMATSLGNEADDTTPDYDTIVDKGLMDALLCGDGWTTPIDRLLEQAALLLSSNNGDSATTGKHTPTGGGRYILISYALPGATREFLKEVGAKYGLDWKFNVHGSNEHVGISIATKI